MVRGLACDANTWTDTEVVCQVSGHGATTNVIKLTPESSADSVLSDSAWWSVVDGAPAMGPAPGQEKEREYGVPRIESFVCTSTGAGVCSAGGDEVTVHGSYLGSDASQITVTVGVSLLFVDACFSTFAF